MSTQHVETAIEEIIERNLQQATPETLEDFDLPTETTTDEEFVNKADQFIRDPTLNGVDSDLRLVLLFQAVQEEVTDENSCLVACEKCCKEIDDREFAEEFVDAYYDTHVEIKKDLLLSSAGAGVDAVQQRWISFVKDVLTDIIPLIEELISTEPEKVNDSDDFPFYIKGNQIYYDDCPHR
jgi:hypothetical protein